MQSQQQKDISRKVIMTHYLLYRMNRTVKMLSLFCLFAFLPLSAVSQGLPLIRNYTAGEYMGHNRNYDIEIGEDGTVFVANFEGLLYYDRAKWHMLHTPDVSRLTVVYRDSRNTIWVGGYNIFARLGQRPNGELFMQQVGKPGLFNGEVMEIFEEDGTLQFVASDNNIYEVKGESVILKKHTNAQFRIGVESDVISLAALKEGGENAILTDITQTEPLDGGLQVQVKKNCGLIITDQHGHELYTITESNGLCSNQVSYVAYDGHGRLWGATLHGIFSIEIPSVYSYFLAKDGLTGEVHDIMAFDGKIYVGGTNGLFAIASRQCKRVNDINNICWALRPSSEGMLVATSSGIYKIAHGGGISRMTSNATTAMLVDGNKVYAGEPDGVWLYQSGQRSRVNELPLVTEIRSDGHGNLWFRNVHGQTIGTDPGKENEPMQNLPSRLLKPISNIEVKAQYRDKNHLWIGGDEILAVIETDKQQLSQLTDSCRLRFRSIIMRGDSILWGGYGEAPKTLPRLSSNHRHLRFYYAIDFTPLSGKTLYRYKLNDNQWSVWSEKQDVEFLNLPYGSFTLSVQAQLADGKLSEVATIDFSIAYPFFMRWYMLILYLIIIALLVNQLFRYRLKRLKRDKIKLEHIVQERTADLRNAQHELIRQEKMASVGKLTEGLIDRILNPMNYIINFSKMSNDLLKDLKENIDSNKDNLSEDDYEDAQDVLGMLTQNLKSVDQYGQNTTRTLKAMEELLKDRTGGFVDTDLLPVLQRNVEMFNNYYAKEQEQYHIQATFQLPDVPMPLHGNPDMLSKTVMSLLANAVYAVVKKAQKTEYTPEISLAATIADGRYMVKIRDNGVGIEEKNLAKVFDPFFTTKTTNEAAGVGLYLSREIIQNHGGDISVSSVKGEYTEFTVHFVQLNKKRTEA